MNEKVIATKITQGVKTVKVTYNCEHCGRTHSHGLSVPDTLPIHRTSHCPKFKGGVFILPAAIGGGK